MVHGPHDDFASDDSSQKTIFSDSYDPDKIISSATDSRGHSVKMRVNVPPGLYSVGAELAASRLLDGIKTIGDACRDSFYHRFRHYSEMVNTTDPILAARLLDNAERERSLGAVEEVLRRRKEDEDTSELTIRMLTETGIAYLPIAEAAARTIRTEEYKDRLLYYISTYRARM